MELTILWMTGSRLWLMGGTCLLTAVLFDVAGLGKEADECCVSVMKDAALWSMLCMEQQSVVSPTFFLNVFLDYFVSARLQN
jgi:hypothetical protein